MSPLTVLLVEPDAVLANILVEGLLAHAYQVTIAPDPNAARAHLDQSFDLWVIDVPDADAEALIGGLRAAFADVPVIRVSDAPRTATEPRQQFLARPVTVSELLTHLVVALDPDSAPEVERLADPGAVAEVALVEEASRRLSGLRAFRGDFVQKPFPEVLAELHRWRAGGALLVQRDRVKKILYFRDGAIHAVKSNRLSECLGRVLVKERLISEQECAESVQRMKATGRRQGTVLVTMGCISPQNLTYGLSLQLRAKLYDVFGWASGEFQFVPHVELPEGVHPGLSPAGLIYEGIRRSFPTPRLATQLGDVEALYPRASERGPAAFEGVELPEDEARLLEGLDGRQNVAQLRRSSTLASTEMNRLLYTLVCSQDLEFLPRASPTETMRPAMPLPYPGGPLVEAELRPALRTRLDRARLQDHFDLLEIDRDASPDATEQAFLDLASAYHPDRYAHLGSVELRAMAAEIYERAARAFEVLGNAAERSRYRRALDQGQPLPLPASSERLLRAELRFQEGQRRLAANQLAEAFRSFREAVDLYPQEGSFYAHLGWCQYRLDPQRYEEALSWLERASELSPGLDLVYVFMARIHQAEGNKSQAIHLYERALTCNPGCEAARVELRLLRPVAL